MKDEHERPTSLPTNARDGHGPTLRHHGAGARARHDETIRRLEALRSAHDVPRLGTWMTVPGTVAVGQRASPREQRLHIACSVWRVGCDLEGTDERDLLTPRGPPLFIGNGVEPVPAENFRDRSSRPPSRIGCRSRRILIDMPVHRAGRQYPKRRLRRQ